MMRFSHAIVALSAVFCGSPVWAQTCSFSMSDMNFGFVNLAGGASPNSTATLNVTCNNNSSSGLSVRICANINAGSGGQVSGVRQMKLGSTSTALNYQLYQDALRLTPWGSVDQTAIGSPLVIDMLLPALINSATYTVYGRISASQASAAKGLYTSSFAGMETRFNYAAYTLGAPSCTGMTQGLTRVPFTVTAAVEPTCIVSAQSINFGSHGVLRTAVDATGSISLTCTANLPYTVSLNGGLSNSPPAARRMTRSGAGVTYGLYRDTNRANVWGSAAGQIASGTGNGSAQTLTVYGRVPAQNTPAPGLYSDTVVVTVNY